MTMASNRRHRARMGQREQVTSLKTPNRTPASIRASFENRGVFISVRSQTKGLSPALATIGVYVRSDIIATHLRRAARDLWQRALRRYREMSSAIAKPALQKDVLFQYLLAPRESGGKADALDLGSITGMSAWYTTGRYPSKIKGFFKSEIPMATRQTPSKPTEQHKDSTRIEI